MPMIKVVKTIDTASSHVSLSMSYHATKIENFSKGIESLQWGGPFIGDHSCVRVVSSLFPFLLRWLTCYPPGDFG